MRKAPVWVAMILDESGSMQSVKSQTISGFNEYLQDRKEDSKKNSVKFWLTTFHSTISEKLVAADVSEAKDLTDYSYRPDHMTALYDAIGKTLRSIDEEIKRTKTKPKILVTIFTDGLENASNRFSKSQIESEITERESKGNWTFTYVGANQDSVKTAAGMGIRAANSVNYSAQTTNSAFRGISQSTSSYLDDSNSMQTFGFFQGAQTAEEIVAPKKRTRKK